MSATFRARYDGSCAECGDTILRGDACTWVDDQVVHDSCLARPHVDGKPAEVCPRCFTEKARNGECACG